VSNKSKLIIYCIRCRHETHHDIVKELSKHFYPDDTPDMGIDYAKGAWEILRCRGCENITFRETWITSEDPEPEVRLFPPRNENMLQIRGFYNLPRALRRIYREVIDCYNNEIYTLCAAGLRTLIEGICLDNKIKNGPVKVTANDKSSKTIRKTNLEGKIEGMIEKGIISKKRAESLHEHRFLGNEAVHELRTPSPIDLKLAIEIIEHTLDNLYEIPDKVEEIKWKRMKRSKGKKKRS